MWLAPGSTGANCQAEFDFKAFILGQSSLELGEWIYLKI